jgi:hypothetical protein
VIAGQPAWAKSLIIAELHEDQSDSQTDYFNSKVVKTVALAWSKSTRDSFKEMRKAAGRFTETEHLVTGGTEHREKYSMGRGYYLAGDGSSYSGWQIRKCNVAWHVTRHTDVSRLGLMIRGAADDAEATYQAERAAIRAATDAVIAEDVATDNREVGTLGARVEARLAANNVYPFPPAQMAALAPLAHVDTGAALQADIVNTLTALLARVKPQMYSTDAYAAAATDADAVGQIVSKFFLWDGTLVLRMAQSALEDCNFKKESGIVGLMATEAEA